MILFDWSYRGKILNQYDELTVIFSWDFFIGLIIANIDHDSSRYLVFIKAIWII